MSMKTMRKLRNRSCMYSRRRIRAIIIYLGVFLIFTFFSFMIFLPSSGDENASLPELAVYAEPQETKPIIKKIKKILVRSEHVARWKHLFGTLQSSEVNACEVTDLPTLAAPTDWDAVVWDFKEENLANVLKAERNPKTYYVFSTKYWPHMSFVNIITKNNLEEVFNLTMTNRRDSDFVVPFFKSEKLKKEVADTIPNLSSRPNFAMYEAKDCRTDSGREILMASLQKHIVIDTYGDCGSMKCTLASEKECDVYFANRYKFQFILEKCLCHDFITDKINRAYRLNAIPVVYGIGLEKLDLPPNSYIDVLDFPSVKRLAEYLLYLNQNDLAYNSYFKWKSEYSFSVGTFRTEGMHELCEFLHRVDNVEATDYLFKPPVIDLLQEKPYPKIKMPAPVNTYSNVVIDGTTKMYNNITQWFHTDICISPKTNKGLKGFISGNEPVGDTPKQTN